VCINLRFGIFYTCRASLYFQGVAASRLVSDSSEASIGAEIRDRARRFGLDVQSSGTFLHTERRRTSVLNVLHGKLCNSCLQ